MGEKERQETCIFIFNFFDKQYFQMVVPWFVSKALGFSPPFWASWLGSDVGSGSPTDECGESRFFRDWKIEVKEGENFFLGGEEVRCMSCCVFCCCKTLDWLPFFLVEIWIWIIIDVSICLDGYSTTQPCKNYVEPSNTYVMNTICTSFYCIHFCFSKICMWIVRAKTVINLI